VAYRQEDLGVEKLCAVPRRVDARDIVDVVAILLQPVNGRYSTPKMKS
jgi:predicted nucleotidyltransferase component of viral defense system